VSAGRFTPGSWWVGDYGGELMSNRIRGLAFCSGVSGGQVATAALAAASRIGLFWSNINPYGRFRLDMDTRLDLSAEGPAVQHRESVL
jgi:hypothetical protein